MNDKELTDRYIYQVVRRLPKEQRDEVSLELQELISDMSEEEGSVEATLIKLGDPVKFAQKYMDDSRHLIGPAYFDTYVMVLKIALLCAVISIFIVSLVEGMISREIWSGGADAGAVTTAIIKIRISDAVANTINTAIGVFGVVTLIFAIMERNTVDIDGKKEKTWNVNDLGKVEPAKKAAWSPRTLSPVPHSKAVIKRSESIISIVFTVILGVLVIFAPHFFGVIFVDGDVAETIPIVNLDKWNIILPFFLASLIFGLADDILRLVVGRYNLRVMFGSIIAGGFQIVLSVIILKVLPFWNPDFGNELEKVIQNQHLPTEFFKYFNATLASNIFLAFLIVITALEIITTIYKTLRYGLKGEPHIIT